MIQAAYHEAGHAIAAIVLGFELAFVDFTTANNGMFGTTSVIRVADQCLGASAREDLAIIALAGRAAELVGTGRLTIGCADDVARARELLSCAVDADGARPYRDVVARSIRRLRRRAICLIEERRDKLSLVAEELHRWQRLPGDYIRDMIVMGGG